MEKEASRRVPAADAAILDTYLILKNKEQRFAEFPGKLAVVRAELAALQSDVDELMGQFPAIEPLCARLGELHSMLYDIEDEKRAVERGEEVEQLTARLMSEGAGEDLRAYLALSRKVSLYNDERARIKREINGITGSALAEAKGHPAT